MKEKYFSVIYNWLGYLIRILYVFIVTPIVIKALGVESYGEWNSILAIVAYLSLLDFGLRPALNRYIFRNYNKDDGVVRGVYFFTLCSLSLIFLLLFAISYFFSDFATSIITSKSFDGYSLLASVLVINLFATIFSEVLAVKILALENFLVINLIPTIVLIVKFLVIVNSDWPTENLTNFAYFETLSNVAILLIFYVASTSKAFGIKIKPANRDDFKFNKKEFLAFGFKSKIGSFSYQLNTNADLVIIAKLIGASSVASYAICLMLSTYIAEFASKVRAVFFPTLCNQANLNEPISYSEIISKTFRIQTAVFIPLILVLMVFGQSFIMQWTGAISITYTLLFLILLNLTMDILISPYGDLLGACNKIGYFTSIEIIFGVFNVVLSIILVYIWHNIEVVALSTVIASVFKNFLKITYLKKLKVKLETSVESITILSIILLMYFVPSSYLQFPSFNLLEVILSMGGSYILVASTMLGIIYVKSRKDKV